MNKIILSTLLIFSISLISFAQEAEKTVTITVSGSGKTQDEAKQSALRSAIEQAFGAFISSKTEILNDQVVADQMSSVSSGNIQSFTVLNESQLPDGSWANTIKAIVSISNLTSFVVAKGFAVEIKGGLFAINIKQQMLNEQGEIDAVADMVGLLHETMQTAFDYSINSGEPKSLDAENKNWEIPLFVTANTNKNMDFCANYCINTLSALGLSKEEIENYRNLNKTIFQIAINYKGVSKTIYLRKKHSFDALKTFANQWKFYTSLFSVQPGMDQSNSNARSELHVFSDGPREYDTDTPNSINFLTTGQKAASFRWEDKRSLTQIEKMSGYSVNPRGIVSRFEQGGFVVWEKNGRGFVVAIIDLPKMEWESANTSCNELVINGYKDWLLPSKFELYMIYKNLNLIDAGNFKNEIYWSSDKDSQEQQGGAYRQIINGYATINFGVKNYEDAYNAWWVKGPSYENNVRAIRYFK